MSMKKISIIVTVIVFTVLSIAVVIILNFTKGDMRVNVFKSRTKVGLVTEYAIDDGNWSQSHYEALLQASEESGVELKVRSGIVSDDTCTKAISELIEKEGCFMVIVTAKGCGNIVKQAALAYPEKFFVHIGSDKISNNLTSFDGRMYQVRYLAGILAGAQTKTGNIGYVASSPSSPVNADINAFTLGVRKSAPDACVHVSFTGSMTDDEKAESAAEYLINDCGSDILTISTETISPLYTAEKYGVLTIGCCCDNREKLPTSYLSSCLWNWKPFYSAIIGSCFRGTFRGISRTYDIGSGIADLAEPSKSGGEELIKEARTALTDHTSDVFYGPITDNSGTLRVAEDEAMSDGSVSEHFDWYVEGVKIEDRD